MGTRTFSAVIAVAVAALGFAAGCTPPDTALVGFPASEPDGSPVTAVAPDSAGPLRFRGPDLVDDAGRVVLLHGMNSVQKSAPYVSLLADGSLGTADRAYLVGNGFNAVRLGVSYGALMPQPGVVDAAYLDRVVEVVEALTADRLWVQLDFHQDVFHLMPDWATPPDARSLSDQAPSIFAWVGWAAAYTSPRSIRTWDAFLDGEASVAMPDGSARSVASLLGDAAAALAAQVADDDLVIGIEVLNEPFAGSSFLACIVAGCRGADARLAARSTEIAAAIRSAAPEMNVWAEPFAPTGYLAAATLPIGPLPPTASGPGVGVAWHLYCNETDGGSVSEAPAQTAILCQQRFVNGFDNGARLSAALDAPLLLNEFGASNTPLDATLVTRLADERLVSWMYWHHGGGVDGLDSSIPDEVESQIVRPYPQATAGRPEALSFDPATGRFRFRFIPDPTIEAPTSVVVPARHYPRGYDVTVSGGTVTSAPQSGRLTVVADGSGVPVTIELARR